jgi:beta-galactosidase
VPYLHVLFAWHRALTALGIVVDFVRADGDLTGYTVVVAPAHVVATDAQVANLSAFAESGTLVVGFATAVTDEDLHVRLNGYLGEPLRRALGVWIEEFAPPAGPDLRNLGSEAPPPLGLSGEVFGGDATGAIWAEYLRIEDADIVATFTGGNLDGWPAVTRRATRGGAGWYVATLPEPQALRRLAERIVTSAGVDLPLAVARDGQVEAVRRGSTLFLINQGADAAVVTVDGTDVLTGAPTSGLTLPPQGVAIIDRPGAGSRSD